MHISPLFLMTQDLYLDILRCIFLHWSCRRLYKYLLGYLKTQYKEVFAIYCNLWPKYNMLKTHQVLVWIKCALILMLVVRPYTLSVALAFLNDHKGPFFCFGGGIPLCNVLLQMMLYHIYIHHFLRTTN